MASCENCYKAFEAGYEEAELAYINADRAKIVADAHQMTQDLQRIAQELGIGARPYSGHEAMERDILPEIRTPFCGRGNCLPPGYANLGEWLGIFSDAEARETALKDLERILNDLSAWRMRWRQLLTERIHRHSTRNPLA